MSFLFRIARKSAGILVAAMLVSLFTGLMVVKYPLIPWINYNLIRDIHVFFILIVLIPAFYLHSLGGIIMLLNGKGLAKTRIQQGSVIVGWAAVFLVFGLIYSTAAPVAAVPGSATNVTGPAGFKSPLVTLTPAEISAHSSAGSCWVIIGSRVYDLTGFLSIHPGGTGTILPYCGKDGSAGFATKDIGVLHSPYAETLLSAFYIGDLGAAVTATPRPGTTLSSPSQSLPPAPSVTASSPVTLTPAEIAAHSSAGSCWMIIGGKVYDLTSFLFIHPGGAGTIAPYCGKDGSAAFATKDKGSSHSSYADTLLSAFYIGDLGAAVTATPRPGVTLSAPSGSLPPAPSVAAGSPVTLTPAEIATHGTTGNCWMIIGGKVYDLTSFLSIHPGGAGTIAPYCGKDGSAAFATKDKGSSHSSYADSLLASYFIGDLGTTVNVTPPPGAVNPPRVHRREGRDDD